MRLRTSTDVVALARRRPSTAEQQPQRAPCVVRALEECCSAVRTEYRQRPLSTSGSRTWDAWRRGRRAEARHVGGAKRRGCTRGVFGLAIAEHRALPLRVLGLRVQSAQPAAKHRASRSSPAKASLKQAVPIEAQHSLRVLVHTTTSPARQARGQVGPRHQPSWHRHAAAKTSRPGTNRRHNAPPSGRRNVDSGGVVETRKTCRRKPVVSARG